MPKINGSKKTVVRKPKDLAVTESGVEATTTPVRKATKPHPRLVNRGPAGLLHKRGKVGGEVRPREQAGQQEGAPEAEVNRIDESLRPLVVPIDSVHFDPNNARLHPERNKEAIKASLRLYGQKKPIVVRKDTGVVVAGNGTLEAAKELGWTEIAANISDMTDVEAAGYGLADNRTAELARWDFEAAARIDRLLQEHGHETVGWTKDELEVLRAADWTPPPVVEGDGIGGDSFPPGSGEVRGITFSEENWQTVQRACSLLRSLEGYGEMTDEECVVSVLIGWMDGDIRGAEAENS